MDQQVAHGPISISVEKFWTTYEPSENGEMKAIDWVAYAPKGRMDKARNEDKVSRILKATSKQAAKDIADAIRPAYEAWKAGQDIPLNGTPLQAWPGVSQQQIDILHQFSLRTVEEVSRLTDSELGRLPLPNMRALRDMATRFLDGKDVAANAKKVQQLEEQLAALQALLETRPDQDEPKRRGRPPKVEEAA